MPPSTITTEAKILIKHNSHWATSIHKLENWGNLEVYPYRWVSGIGGRDLIMRVIDGSGSVGYQYPS
jgi:hypothetical protein